MAVRVALSSFCHQSVYINWGILRGRFTPFLSEPRFSRFKDFQSAALFAGVGLCLT